MQLSKNNMIRQQKPPSQIIGGGERVRTDDPLRARQVLSQLSYTPNKGLVGLAGLEPATSRLSVVCSSQLSYKPIKSCYRFHDTLSYKEQKTREDSGLSKPNSSKHQVICFDLGKLGRSSLLAP